MVRIRISLDDAQVGDLNSVIRSEMDGARISSKIKPGSTVAITAGSRGITDIARITAYIVRVAKDWGVEPFVVPAMGSHGGATAAGQTEILQSYGITKETIDAPVVSSMEVVKLGETRSGIPLFIDQKAHEADGIIVVNRIKPHTEFHGQIESGLIKMMVMGLGKHQGAIIAHRYAVKFGYERTITEIGQGILEKAPISLGIGIVENGYGQTAKIAGIAPEKFFEEEKRLLEEVRAKTPKIPFDEIDILVVDQCGKEISGTGIDTKVIGRIMNIYETELNHPKITRIILRDLTEKTHGNAIGVGLADFVTKRVADKFDYISTYVNCVTAVTPEKGRLPIVCENDRKALDLALATSGPVDLKNLRMVWIRNTSSLSEILISQGLLNEAQKRKDVQIIRDMMEIEFDEHDNLTEPWERN